MTHDGVAKGRVGNAPVAWVPYERCPTSGCGM